MRLIAFLTVALALSFALPDADAGLFRRRGGSCGASTDTQARGKIFQRGQVRSHRVGSCGRR